MIYLLPLLRINRALTACYLMPDNLIEAITISESISVITPYLNIKSYSKIITMCIAMLYEPRYLHFYLKWYDQSEKKYYQPELMLLLLFNLYLVVSNV